MPGFQAPRHTEEDIAWAKDTIANRLNNEVKAKKILQLGLTEEYNKKFNRKITISGLYTWLRVVANPSLRKPYKPKETKKVFGARYVLYVSQNAIYGFETEEEVTNFLKNSLILTGSNLSLYEKKELTINYNIVIG